MKQTVPKIMAFTEKDKLKALAVVNIFETGKPFGDYSAVAVLDDGAGISYGISQFTHKSGSLAAVVSRYFNLGGVVGKRVISSREGLLKKKNYAAIRALEGDEEFRKALQAAALTREMRDAQMQITFERYLEPALDACNERGFVLPLSLAVVYDSVTHGSWEKISERMRSEVEKQASDDSSERRRLSADQAAKPKTEKEWIAEYVRVRDKWLASVPRLRKTRYRTEFLIAQINRDNWNLELPIMVNGTKLTDQIVASKTYAQVGPSANRNIANERDEPFQPDLFEVPNETVQTNHQISSAKTPVENLPETLPASFPETDRPQTRAVPAEQEATGSGSSDRKAESVVERCLDKAEEAVNAAAAKYDQTERIVDTVITRKSAAKSLWTTVVGTILQTVWGIAAFLSGIPRSVWLIVAVIAGALMIGFLYRQIALGKIRERSRLSQNED